MVTITHSKLEPNNYREWVRSLGREDTLEKGIVPTLVFLPGESHGQRTLVGYSPWDHKELDLTEQLSIQYSMNKKARHP